ncbi:MAG: tetratricopeptide repeat protein [Myxococcota bacterium]|nr:tetratricopeptide repeat protein [Myxococcota bacterium]
MKTAGAAPRSTAGALLPLALVVAGSIVWANSLGGAFVFDDNAWIVRNREIRDLGSPGELLGGTSRPVLKLTLALNYAAGGLDPRGYHAVNVAIHVLAGLALFGVVRRTLRLQGLRSTGGASADHLAAAAALLWLLHPLQTQAVTYVVQRGESLMGLAYLATLYAAVRVEEGGRRLAWGVLATLACAVGMGTKEVMVTAPVVVLLHDRTFAAGSFPGALRARWGLHAALVATWALPFAVIGPDILLRGEFARPDLPRPDALAYALTQPAVLLHYLRLALWPSPLCFDYGWPPAPDLRAALLPLSMVTTGGLVTAWLVWRRSGAGFLAAAFLLVLAPTSSVMPIADLAVEHRMYLPLAPVCVGAVLLADRVLSRAGARRAWLGGLLLVLVAGALGVATVRRNLDYHDPVRLWRSAAEAAPRNPRAHYNLGTESSAQGQKREAIAAYRASLALDPAQPKAHYNLANALKATGDLDGATAHYAAATALAPEHALAHMNLGNTLQSLGRADEALASYRAALALRPRDPRLLHNYGIALLAVGRSDEALVQLRASLEGRPASVSTRTKLGDALRAEGRIEEAIAAYERSLVLEPGYERAERGLAAALRARDAAAAPGGDSP